MLTFPGTPLARTLLAAGVACVVPVSHAQDSSADGKQIYTDRGCVGCHAQDGRGGMGRKLAGSPRLADAARVIGQILHGGNGMPPFKDQLNDAQVAAVASFVRTSFGNDFGPVDAQQVAELRAHPDQAQTAANGDQQPKAQDRMQVGAAPEKVEQPTSKGPTHAELLKADASNDSWLMYNKGYRNERYSGLSQINARNAARLAPVCVLQLGESSSFQGSPVIYDGLLYITTQYSTYALDATDCKLRWKHHYTPQGPEPFDTNRGVAIADGRVFRGTTDGHVLALDAKSGNVLWNARPVDSSLGYFLSSAPVVWKNMLIMGTAGADWGARARMFAMDVSSGKELWSFDEIVPETFGSAEAAATGGGSNWTSYAIDATRELVYAPVGNPAPDFSARYRPGENLYTNSVIALHLKDGTLSHYYQQVPNDPLDRDTAAPPVVMQLPADAKGKGRDATYLAVTNKAGHLFLYDDTKKDKQPIYQVVTTTRKNAETPPTTQGVHSCPGINGGVEWYGAALHPGYRMLYVPSVDWCSTFKLGEVRYTKGQFFFGGTYEMDPVEQAKGWTMAFQARDGKKAWQYKSDAPMVAGLTPTAGGVIFTGELTGDFIVLDAQSGRKLYRFYTGGPIAGGVSTYQIGKRQYVAVPSGNMSRTWSPDTNPAATVFIFALPEQR
jgi:alcohol dehydrogenase (cytochrome c)